MAFIPVWFVILRSCQIHSMEAQISVQLLLSLQFLFDTSCIPAGPECSQEIAGCVAEGISQYSCNVWTHRPAASCWPDEKYTGTGIPLSCFTTLLGCHISILHFMLSVNVSYLHSSGQFYYTEFQASFFPPPFSYSLIQAWTRDSLIFFYMILKTRPHSAS